MTTLANCWSCASSNVKARTRDGQAHVNYVRCEDCHARTGNWGTRENAIAAWNRCTPDLAETLKKIEGRLNCQGDKERAHYCPNCDNSLYDVREIARAALASLSRDKP